MNQNWNYLIGIAFTIIYLEYQCSILKKSCIYALIFWIPLSDIGIKDLRAKSSHLGVYCTNID